MVSTETKTVSIAPLVLLSVVDHYERIVRSSESSIISSNKRVVGVILGSNVDNTIRISNSFAIPYEEDETNSDIWFLDHNYIDSMMEMFKKINAKEKLIGWYHSGPKLKQNDLKINEVFKTFTPNPLLLIVDVNSTDKIDIPTDCYMAIEEIKEDGSANEKTFLHYPSIIEAEEAEEIGVEHLLRDIRDENRGNLTISLSNNFKSLKSLNERISNIVKYLCKLITGELPINSTILGKLQDIFNLLPNISQITDIQSGNPNQVDALIYSHEKKLATAFNIKTNDELMIMYVSSLVRSIIAFHDLIDNKIENRKKNADSTTAESEESSDDKVATTEGEPSSTVPSTEKGSASKK
ncbi:proteasome regulatory particle subunit [Pichia californica]|uniref:Proteasome regulatory particle subunit n=1 Tax=Pichia californica TaxID=460514 RepID=A0A9P6WLG9_9ASCO|nr:proteasome regulatory particle subunit [[Candida] californica]KAG0689202.1 proteasome regulatory particle subunit [[Candida] californica]